MSEKGNIAVDVGNSSIKSGLFVGEELVERKVFSSLQELGSYYSDLGSYAWVFSSVKKSREDIGSMFREVNPLILDRRTPLPLKINYDTPETLGVDRLAAAVGAWSLHENQNILVIDAGSCITYDVVDKNGVFQGGVIAPGLKMRMKAMNHFTDQLPDISQEWETLKLQRTGKSTKECLLNGSFTATIHEIEGFLTSFMKEYADLIVVLTGGDAVHFESKLKPPIFADLNLVLTGLNRILNFNK